MKTPDQIKIELKDALPVHFHKGDPEPHLTPFNYHALECLHADALSYIQRLETQVPRWISVEERLPEVDTGVLIAVRHTQTDQFYVRYDWRIKTTERCWWWKNTSESNVADLLDVTHWMPLPEPPKEEHQ